MTVLLPEVGYFADTPLAIKGCRSNSFSSPFRLKSLMSEGRLFLAEDLESASFSSRSELRQRTS